MSCPVCGHQYEESCIVKEALSNKDGHSLCVWFGADHHLLEDQPPNAAAVFIHDDTDPAELPTVNGGT